MALPFPGMDPFLEGPQWPDFHVRFLVHLSEKLAEELRPRYFVVAERRVYVETPGAGDEPGRSRPMVPDLVVAATRLRHVPARGVERPAAPLAVALPMPRLARETYLELRLAQGRELVAVIELLSPANKRPGAGRREYLEKREAVLSSRAHLVELDLLRGGERLPMAEPLPASDYLAIVSRAEDRPLAGVWPFTLREPLPTITLPLAGDDPDLPIDLQSVFAAAYCAAGYDYSLSRELPLEPPLAADDLAWVQNRLRAGLSGDSEL